MTKNVTFHSLFLSSTSRDPTLCSGSLEKNNGTKIRFEKSDGNVCRPEPGKESGAIFQPYKHVESRESRDGIGMHDRPCKMGV